MAICSSIILNAGGCGPSRFCKRQEIMGTVGI